MNSEKIYIGKGKQVNEMEIVKVTLKYEELAEMVYEKEGVKYVSFEIAKLKNEDKFGRTHTCYYNKKEK
jgi:hypothetical protein